MPESGRSSVAVPGLSPPTASSSSAVQGPYFRGPTPRPYFSVRDDLHVAPRNNRRGRAREWSLPCLNPAVGLHIISHYVPRKTWMRCLRLEIHEGAIIAAHNEQPSIHCNRRRRRGYRRSRQISKPPPPGVRIELIRIFQIVPDRFPLRIPGKIGPAEYEK